MRAIILAAGMGTRMRPLTLTTPKSLVEVNGIPMLERQIEFLKEKGINEIIVVTGYLKEKFEYLKSMYNVTLINNDAYDKYNNLYTMNLVSEYLPGSYVLEADVYLNENFLLENPKDSLYFSAKREEFNNEWILRFDANNKVYDIEIGTSRNEYILCGVSFWSIEDGIFIKGKIKEAMKQGNYSSLYWDDIVKNNISKLNVFIKKIKATDCFEIDSLEELEDVNKYFAL
ncbi:CTP--phosphocholine cytidylyltransferase [Bacillus sp. FJAT-27225]|uniref:NTP transferase domain-containing protein n=1 Tax=Bacillus sp. FJAT-27225 TaxID=1743144 RepID=UPI00080C24D1|nr:NTP transferase domain-containing protein [Bacillus sp. FJAT-27225]OCA88282.1 CTP--phosphocholine cytidylyltransferase [Bacillus sp. FJAT-27225]